MYRNLLISDLRNRWIFVWVYDFLSWNQICDTFLFFLIYLLSLLLRGSLSIGVVWLISGEWCVSDTRIVNTEIIVIRNVVFIVVRGIIVTKARRVLSILLLWCFYQLKLVFVLICIIFNFWNVWPTSNFFHFLVNFLLLYYSRLAIFLFYCLQNCILPFLFTYFYFQFII